MIIRLRRTQHLFYPDAYRDASLENEHSDPDSVLYGRILISKSKFMENRNFLTYWFLKLHVQVLHSRLVPFLLNQQVFCFRPKLGFYCDRHLPIRSGLRLF